MAVLCVLGLRYGSSLHLSLIPHRDHLCRRLSCLKNAGERSHGVRLEQIAQVERVRHESAAELHPFPLNRFDLIGKASNALPSNASAGIGWACRHRRIDGIMLSEPDGFALRFQTQKESSLGIHIMIFQIEAGQPGIIPPNSLLTYEGVERSEERRVGKERGRRWVT